MRNVQRYDSLQLVAGAVIDTDGFMRDSPIVARTGVYEYRNPMVLFAVNTDRLMRFLPVMHLIVSAANLLRYYIRKKEKLQRLMPLVQLSEAFYLMVIKRMINMLPAILLFLRRIKWASTVSCLWVIAVIARKLLA